MRMQHLSNIAIVFLVLLSSCIKKQNYDIIVKEFQNEEWSRFEFLEGSIEIKKVPVTFDVVMEVVVSEQYPSFYELHQKDGLFMFNLTVRDSDGIYRTNDYRFRLKDKDGYWNADKKDGYYTFHLPVMNEITLSESDIYKFTIENKYSKDPLQGIKSISLKYINSK